LQESFNIKIPNRCVTFYLAGQSTENSAVSIFKRDGAVFFVNDHLSAVFRSVYVIWLAGTPHRVGDDGVVVAPVEGNSGRAQSVRPVA
jgi:hypothetical protein